MIKYFEELDDDYEFILPLVNNSSYLQESFMRDCFQPISPSFLDKHIYIFELILKLENFIETINVEEVYNLIEKYPYQERFDIYACLERFEETIDNISDKRTIITYYDLNRLINDICMVIENLALVKPQIFSYFEKEYHLLNRVKKEIDNEFVFSIPNEVVCPIKFPRTWYITKYGDLYHPGFNNPHKETNLVYPLESIKEEINSYKKISGSKEYYFDLKKDIQNKKYINMFQFDHYLHFIHRPVSSSFDKFYDIHTVTLVKGIVSANAALYSFFKDMELYCDNPKKELQRLNYYCNNDFADLLVRALNFHKVERVLEKTITTSSLTPYTTFKEYIKRGWNINVVKPIVVDRYLKKLIEVDVNNSYMVEKLLEKDLEEYEVVKTKTYGKIY